MNIRKAYGLVAGMLSFMSAPFVCKASFADELRQGVSLSERYLLSSVGDSLQTKSVGASGDSVSADTIPAYELVEAQKIAPSTSADIDSTVMSADSIDKSTDSLAVVPDSLSITSDSLASTVVDSLALRRSKVDTSTVKGGVMTLNSAKLLEQMYKEMDDSLKSKKFKVVEPESEIAKERSRLFKDSISFSTVSAISFALPGFGQLYNKQAWKIPILYGTVGGFATGAALLGKQYKKYNSLYNEAVYNQVPFEESSHYLQKANSYRTQRTLCIAGAAVSYLYFIGDAAMNYKGAVHNTRKATVLSAVFPGAGQVYNKQYWKLPIVWGGIAAFGYVIDYNNRGYQRFKKAYNMLTDGDPNTVDEFGGRYDAEVLQNTRDSYRRYRDLGIIMTCGFYLLNIVDAHVSAYLRQYDISDDLSMKVEPTMISAPRTSSRGGSDGLGMAMKLKF